MMASLTIVDMLSRTKPMAEKKKWIAKATSEAHGQFRRKAKEAGDQAREAHCSRRARQEGLGGALRSANSPVREERCGSDGRGGARRASPESAE